MMAKRKSKKEIYKKKKGFFSVFLRMLGYFFIFLILICLGFFIYFAKDLPRPERFTEHQFIQSTKVYDRTGTVLLYEVYGEEKRSYVTLDKIPKHLQDAILVAEDANFYHHVGIDIKGIFRAILKDIKIGEPIYGGSTIPQQLIRSTFLTTEKTPERKIREIILALELDRRYSKEQILEWYLNQVPFGQNAYGVEEAAQTYFKKPVSEITLPEAATLAALIRAPSYLSPYRNETELLERKNYILERMASLGYISEKELQEAKETKIKFVSSKGVKAPYFTVEYILPQLEKTYSLDFLRQGGFKIYTSLDWELQKLAEEIIEKGVERNKAFGAYNAALVAINPKTGEVLAMVGGAGYDKEEYPPGCEPQKNCKFSPHFNVATLGLRQPGSAFKPFVYATAFKKGFTPDTIVVDEKTNFGVWGGKPYIPENYDGLFRGEITLREALAQSINVASVRVLRDYAGLENMEQGLEDSVKTAKELGITTLKPPFGPSIVLGGWEVNLLEMTSAYGVFATEGLKFSPISILRIEDSKGNIIKENKSDPQRVLEANVARMVNDILSDNTARAPMFGLHSPLYFKNYQVAVKTGTTQYYQDAWTIGYTPSLVVGVWVGNNDNSSMVKKPAVSIAGPIFHEFMEKVLQKFPKEEFTKPEY
ncbi:PBP1A family penicillin-binding protein [bacterium]|nr:PBP1A family penicillin-binding protein [bacterium]